MLSMALDLIVGRYTRPPTGRRVGIALAATAVVFALLAVGAAVPTPPAATLEVDDATPFVGETVRFDASRSVGHDEGNGRIVAYRFEFGDGAVTAWQESAYAQHAYRSAGPQTSRVTVRDARGLEGEASASLDVLAIPPPTGDAPDLTPIGASTRPHRPEVDTVVVIAIAIVNRGGVSADTAAIDVTDEPPEGEPVLLDSISLGESLAPGASIVLFSSPFIAEVVGEHEIVVEVRDVRPVETLTADNLLRIPMVVVPAGGDGPVGGSAFTDPVVFLLLAAAVVAFFSALAILSRSRPEERPQPSSPEPRDESPPPPWPP
jgi:hypothetical protein